MSVDQDDQPETAEEEMKSAAAKRMRPLADAVGELEEAKGVQRRHVTALGVAYALLFAGLVLLFALSAPADAKIFFILLTVVLTLVSVLFLWLNRRKIDCAHGAVETAKRLAARPA